MGARGRPTPQPASAEGPRFRDRLPGEYRRPDVNPYVTLHRSFSTVLLTAAEAWEWRGRWAERFGRDAPLVVEIGSGNGEFMAALAAREREHNVLGIELRYKRTILCAKKILRAGVTNALVARYHAAYLDDLLDPGTVAGFWVNHPDPWPRTRHDKNRLVSRWFLEDVSRLLIPGGFLRMKTDFLPNVTRAETLIDHDADGHPVPPLPLVVTGKADDVTTGSAPWPDDIETNYQSKFRKRGMPVYAIELRKRVIE
jgi:tRNA (guanine-N7-)-methyltransferase